MHEVSKTKAKLKVEPGLEGFQRYWPQAEDACGYGVSAFIGPDLILCRLYDLKTCELLTAQRMAGSFEGLSSKALNAVINDLFIVLAEASDIELSKITSAVISGPTLMECAAAGVDPADASCPDDEYACVLGYDLEYMIAGPKSIAVGEAFYVPCLSAKVGGDFLCSLLALDMLSKDESHFVVDEGQLSDQQKLLAHRLGEELAIGVLSASSTVNAGIESLLEQCGAAIEQIEHLLVIDGSEDAQIPEGFEERAHSIYEAAIEGASAVLLSDLAEDELSRIVDACKIVKL